MNKERRKVLSNARDRLSKVLSEIEDIKSAVEAARDEEQEYFDSMHENLQGGDKGSAAESAVGELDEAISALEGAAGQIEDATGNVERAEA